MEEPNNPSVGTMPTAVVSLVSAIVASPMQIPASHGPGRMMEPGSGNLTWPSNDANATIAKCMNRARAKMGLSKEFTGNTPRS
jgi:hypothetical protein